MMPLEGPRGTVRGRVVCPDVPSGTECIIIARHRGVTQYLPARRVNRRTDPTHIYICEDGRLWWSDHAPAALRVTAEVVTDEP